MALRRIALTDLAPGEPVRFDVFAGPQGDAPVLRKGQRAPDRAWLRRWLEAGLFADDAPAPSVLQMLNHLNQRLDVLLHDLAGERHAEAELRAIAGELIRAVALDADIALACIFLNQIAGSYAVRHCLETALVAVLVARAIGRAERDLRLVAVAALTMNVGMLRYNNSFQNKASALSRAEMAIVRHHPEAGADLLKFAGVRDEEWIDCVIQHHENDDGSGYPDGKTREAINDKARLIGLADRYCAHVSARNYRRSLTPDAALRKLFHEGAPGVDKQLAGQFAEQLGSHPPGCLVRLHNGEIGVVARRERDAVQVHALRDEFGMVMSSKVEHHTSEPPYRIEQTLSEDEVGVRFSMQQIWGELARL